MVLLLEDKELSIKTSKKGGSSANVNEIYSPLWQEFSGMSLISGTQLTVQLILSVK